jgi:L-fuconolactonase
MPDVPIVDAHLHLWDPHHFRMPWLDGNTLLDRPYTLQDYREQTEGLEIAAMVYVQVEVDPAYAFLEAGWTIQQANLDPRLQGIVAWAPLEHGDQCRAYLTELVGIDSRIKGVRRIIQFEPDPDFCLQPDFVRGVQMLPEYDLSFDLCINHMQLPQTIELVRRCPDTSFMLDHIAKPDIAGRNLDPWRDRIRELASFPQVFCKISGLVTEADMKQWTTDDLAPYVSHVLEAFGEDRVAYGGDWPVVLQASPYRRWVETLDLLTAQLSPMAQQKLWAGNGRRFYRLSSA